ncbi:uncharacterized protein LOC120627324 [Pararge aegeria]|nr:uncharacterized protein LOC120627324 [Pararge aegeria]
MSNVEVRSTVRMMNVAMGFDVITKMNEKISHSTGLIVYPEIQFRFTITKNLFTDVIKVDIIGGPIRTTNRIQFIPENDVTKVFTVLFDWNSTAISVASWATDIFRPITLELATKEIEFPRICYDCPA